MQRAGTSWCRHRGFQCDKFNQGIKIINSHSLPGHQLHAVKEKGTMSFGDLSQELITLTAIALGAVS